MSQPADHPDPPRRRWMSVLARAPAERIDALLAGCGALPNHTILRGPEGGLVMVRGRAGGGGAAFNLGEMTVTRCTVRTSTGLIGHAYVAGRDSRQAERAALVDALMQDGGGGGGRPRAPPPPVCSSSRCRQRGHERRPFCRL